MLPNDVSRCYFGSDYKLRWCSFRLMEVYVMRKILKSKKGEGYIDVVVGIFALMMVLVLTLNIYEFFVLKQDLDEISGQLIETATFNGCFDSEFDERCSSLEEQFFDFDVTTSAEEYFNATYERVQLGDIMEVTVFYRTYIKGLGMFQIPVTVTSHRSGISEKYFK